MHRQWRMVSAGVAVALVWVALAGGPGLAQAQSGAILSLDPAATNLAIDGASTRTLTLRLADVTAAYGYMAAVTFNPAHLEATAAAFDDSFFPSSMASPPGWNAAVDNVAGRVYFARTRQNPEPPVTGTGPLATITFRARAGAPPGATTVGLERVRLADAEGRDIAFTLQTAAITLYNIGRVQGSVVLQGRTNHGGATVVITNANGFQASTVVAADGTWSIPGVPVGSCDVTVEMQRYLDARKGNAGTGVTVVVGTNPVGSVKLLGGDANDDDRIDIADAAVIGGAFGVTPVVEPRADINADGLVDIVDMVLMGANYMKASVNDVPWP